MEYKIPLLAKKLANNLKGKSLDYIYQNLKESSAYSHFYKTYKEYDIIVLIFLIKEINENPNEEIKNLYDKIKNNLFAFSIIEIENFNAPVECRNCYGSGDVECDDCGGEGRIECDDCGGDGEDSDGDSCNQCSGEGQLDCDYCSNGYVTCDNCNGHGEVEDENYSQITELTYFSINPKVYSFLSKQEGKPDLSVEIDMEKLPIDEFLLSYGFSGLTPEITESDDFMEGDYIFNGVEKINENSDSFVRISGNSIDVRLFHSYIE